MREAAEYIIRGLSHAIGQQQVTYDLARLMPAAQELSCSVCGSSHQIGCNTIRW